MGRWDAQVDRLEADAAELNSVGRPADAAAVLNAAGLAALEGGLHDRARGLFERVAVLFTAAHRLFEAAAAEANLALLAMRTGDLDEALGRYEQALRPVPGAAEQYGGRAVDLREANVRVNLGVLHRRRNDLDAAAGEYVRAQELYRRHGELTDVRDVEANLAVLDERAGRLDQARVRLIAVRKQLPHGVDDRARARAATTLAAVAAQQGGFAEATALLDEARATYTTEGLPRELADVLTNQGYVHLHLGDLGAARAHLEHAEWLFGQMGMRLDRARVLGGLGSLALRLGDVDEAVDRFRVALDVYIATDLLRESAAMLVNLGVARSAAREWSAAVELLEAALEIYAETGSREDGPAQAEHNLGVALAGQGDHQAAAEHYRRAARAHRRNGRVREAAELTMNLGIAAAARGDTAGARRRHRAALRELRGLGLWRPVARATHNLGLTWASGTAARRDRVVPAWLALDAERFGLPGPAERARWRDGLAEPAAAAFEAAGYEPLLLAEVIEHARSVGITTTADAPPPPQVAGLLGVPVPVPAPGELPGRRPPLVDCGWSATLHRHREGARVLRGDKPEPARGAASLVALLLAPPSGTS